MDLVPVPGGVTVPDFRLVHGERRVLAGTVGCWQPESLRKKFGLLRKSGRTDVLAAAERLARG